jgi:hypothetical protein
MPSRPTACFYIYARSSRLPARRKSFLHVRKIGAGRNSPAQIVQHPRRGKFQRAKTERPSPVQSASRKKKLIADDILNEHKYC